MFGRVSILSNEDLQKILSIPECVKQIAYLCLGYVKEFANKPDLEKAGWHSRLELDKVICYEKWNHEEQSSSRQTHRIHGLGFVTYLLITRKIAVC